MEIIPGEATFTCEIARTDISATWKCGDVLSGGGNKYEISTEGAVHTLRIHEVTGEDEASYTAVFRDAETTAKLTVKGNRNILSQSFGKTGII